MAAAVHDGNEPGPAHGARGPFPDDTISRLLLHLVRAGGLLEPHDHSGVHGSMSEVLALAELSAEAGLTQAELGERLALEKSTVSRLVAGMERRGWVHRERDPDNRRYVRLKLTEHGEHAAATVGTHLHEHHQAILASLTDEELQALTVGLTALARAIGHHRSAGHS